MRSKWSKITVFSSALAAILCVAVGAQAFDAGTSPSDARTGNITQLVVADEFLVVTLDSAAFPTCSGSTAQFPTNDSNVGQENGIRSMLLAAHLAGRQVQIRARDVTFGGVNRCMMDWVSIL